MYFKKLMNLMALAVLGMYGELETRAQYVNYQIDDTTKDLVGGFSASLDGKVVGSGFYAGGIQVTKQSGGPADMPAQFTTFCMDVGGELVLGSTYGFSAPTPFAGHGGLAPFDGWGYAQVDSAAAVQNAAYLYYQFGIGPNGVLASGSADQMAGLQLAIWEALYDTGNPLGLGLGSSANADSRFVISGGNAVDYADANNYLSSLCGNQAYPGYFLIPEPFAQNGIGGAGQELLIGAADFTIMPEPATYGALAGAALLLVSLGSQFRKQRKPNRAS